MKNALLVQESHAFDHLLHVALDLIRCKSNFRIIDQAIEIVLAVLEDQVDGALLTVVVCGFRCTISLSLTMHG